MPTIREYRESDRAETLECIALLQEYERMLLPRDFLPGEPMAKEHLPYLLRRCAESDGKLLVAEEGGRIVGYACVWKSVDDMAHMYTPESLEYAYVIDLFVRDEYRGRGIGRALLEAAETHARSLGLRRIMLHVVAENQSAADAYAAMGYKTYNLLLSKDL